MKAKFQSLLVLGLLLLSSQESSAIQLSSGNTLQSQLETLKKPKDHTKLQLKHKSKKSHKKKKHTHHKEDALVEDDNVAKKEAAIITNTVAHKLDQMDASDASLSDMYMFSKVIANGKTVDEAKKEEEKKMQALAVIEKAKQEEADKKNDAFNQIEREEQEKKQEAIDVTTRKMLAQQYEQMEIDDERREGIDNGFQSYKIVSDMKAEQDYAINQYKGSGEMSQMLDEIKSEAQSQRQADKAKLTDVNEVDRVLKSKEVTAEKGEKEIASDSESLYAYSAFAAANAAAQV